ncbi:hypothetical protein MSPP1_002518 [Malassezia sp. CBS 17886]|nr:hypothetical protein MSPP1_002518 [Malassezia sp. CBS 17886]
MEFAPDIALPPGAAPSGAKTEDPAFTGSFVPVFPLLAGEDFESEWSETSPGLSDSLWSLDFDSTAEMSTTVPSSVSRPLSRSALAHTTAADAARMSLFTPLAGLEFASCDPVALAHDTPSYVLQEPCAKRGRTSMDATPPDSAQDFTLFPREEDAPARTRPSVGPSPSSANVLELLNRLNDASATSHQDSFTGSLPAADAPEAVATASPALLTRSSHTPSAQVTMAAPSRGSRRRRRDVEDLLPMDAPIQPRTYHTESATSRRGSSGSPPVSSPDEQNRTGTPTSPVCSSDGKDMDPRSLKRLSNTLAARRSRLRKAEELKHLNDTIDRLHKEAAMWKQRCEAAEKERDRACGMPPTL